MRFIVAILMKGNFQVIDVKEDHKITTGQYKLIQYISMKAVVGCTRVFYIQFNNSGGYFQHDITTSYP